MSYFPQEFSVPQDLKRKMFKERQDVVRKDMSSEHLKYSNLDG